MNVFRISSRVSLARDAMRCDASVVTCSTIGGLPPHLCRYSGWCQNCRSPEKMADICLPYACKLLFQVGVERVRSPLANVCAFLFQDSGWCEYKSRRNYCVFAPCYPPPAVYVVCCKVGHRFGGTMTACATGGIGML